VPLEAWGAAGKTLATLHEGDAVLVKGKLRWKSWEKNGQRQGTLVVSSWHVQAVQRKNGAGSPL
jgi:single-stranded DNA-binding protein